MNTVTFSDYEATTTGLSSLTSGIGYNVEIKKTNVSWSIWAVAQRTDGSGWDWKLTHIRISSSEDTYPCLPDIAYFIDHLASYIDPIMDKLIPSHKNANNEI